MKIYTAVVERSPETGLFVGFIPGFPGAHTQAESLDELNANLREVVSMLLEDGEPNKGCLVRFSFGAIQQIDLPRACADVVCNSLLIVNGRNAVWAAA
jgi:predicted RNase H-like HicB family nuclease